MNACCRADRSRLNRTVDRLKYPEQLIVWSLRKWLENGVGRSQVEQEFLRACRLRDGEVALQALEGLVGSLSEGARRVLYLHRSSCARVSKDEEAVVTLIGACQAGRQDHATALAEWLVRPSAMAGVLGHAQSLAAAMQAHGHNLPQNIGNLEQTPRQEPNSDGEVEMEDARVLPSAAPAAPSAQVIRMTPRSRSQL